MSSVHLQGLRFAEIADVVIPSVARPITAVYDEATHRIGGIACRSGSSVEHAAIRDTTDAHNGRRTFRTERTYRADRA
jgi:hypothetical protein